MPDLKQALRDFVATSNSGKYKSEDELLSKFPELKSYDRKALKDFVATSNSGKYKSEEELLSKFPEFGTSKKKVVSESPSEQPKVSSSLATQRTVEQKPSVSSGSEDNIFSGYPGKEEKKYKLKDGLWYEYSSTIAKEGQKNVDLYEKPIKDAKRVESLNKVFKQNAGTSEYEQTFTGYPGQKGAEYRIRNNSWEKKQYNSDKFVPINNENSAKSLNAYFKKNASFGESTSVKEVNVNAINSDLISKNEEEVVPYLKKQYPDFLFHETGAMTDNIRVTAPNGKKIELPLDNWTDDDNLNVSIELKEFIRQNSNTIEDYLTEEYEKATEKYRFAQPGDREYVKDSPYGQRKILIDPLEQLGFVNVEKEKKIKETRAELVQFKADRLTDIYVRQKEAAKTKSTLDDKEVSAALSALTPNKATVKMTNEYFNDIQKTKAVITKENNDLNNYAQSIVDKLESGEITQEEVDNVYKPQIEQKSNALNQKIEAYKNQSSDLYTVKKGIEDSLAENYVIQESKGSFGGGVAKGFVKGLTYLPRLAMSMSEKEQDDLVKAIVGSGTTEEYTSSEDRGEITKALFSLSESIGTLAGGAAFGGGAVTTAAFFSQGYYDMKDELDKVEGMSDTEKVLMSSSYGILSGLLEKFGVEYSMGKSTALKGVSNSIKNSIMKTAFQTLPKDATKEMIENAIKNSITKQLTSGAIKIVGGAAVEGTTESLQAVSKIGIKEVYDLFQEKSYFDNESAWDITKDVLYEGAMGSLAGGLMSTISSVPSAIEKGFTTSYNKEQINALMNLSEMENSSDQIKAMLKTNIASGKISADDAGQIAKSFDMLTSKLKELPEDLTDDNKAKSLDLIIEKDKLEKQITGKDKALVTAQTDRINAINEELKAISINNSKTEQDATKESTEQQQEVPAESSTGEYQGVDEGQQEVGQGEGGERTTTQPEANISDSNIPSEEAQAIPSIERKIEEVQQKITEVQKVIAPIETKIEEYEQRTENEVVAPNIETTKTKKAKSIPRTRKALEVETNDLQDLVKKHFISGGKINVSSAMQSLFGNKGDKSIASEYRKRIGLHSKGGQTIDGLAHLLWEQNKDTLGESVTTMEWRDAVESVLTNEIGTKNMIDSLLTKSEESVTDEEAKYWENKYDMNAIQDFDESELMDAESVLDNMTDEEMAQMYDEIVASEQAEYNPTIEEISQIKDKKLYTEKAYSFFDELSKQLDKFGKENTSMGIAPAVLKPIIETIKLGLKAGMTIEQAIRDASAKHTVKEQDINDAIYSMSEAQKAKTRERVTGEKQGPTTQKTEASKAAKNISKKTKTKVTVDEYTALKDQLRLEAKAAKDVKSRQKNLIALIKADKYKGILKTPKVQALLNRLQKVKLESDKSVNEFLRYTDNVFKNAEYASDLINSQSLKSKIRKSIKRGGIQAQVVGTLKAFSKIDPKKVEDIKEYIKYAEQLTEASKVTRVTADNRVNFKQAANLKEINKYTADEIKRQDDINKKELMDEYDSLTEEGLLNNSMSLSDMKDYIKSLEDPKAEINEKKEVEIRKYVDLRFKDLSTIINEMISSGKDPFTDKELDISKKDIERLKGIMDINLDRLNIKDAFQIVEHLDNFITNGITSNLDNIQATYDAEMNAETLNKSGVKSKDLKIYFSPKMGRFWGKQFMSLPTFMDNIFGGEKTSLRVAKAMGLTNFMNSKAQAIVQHRTKMAEHKKMFENKKPNGENFNSSKNIAERGVFAYLLRTPINGDVNMFKERVSNTLITIDKLLNSKNKKDIAKGEALNSVADKLGLRDEGVTIESITDNVDPINQQDVNWWVDTWSEIYDELYDVSLAVYNVELSPDSFYTTDTISDTDRTPSMLDDNLSALSSNMRTSVDAERTGVLKENNRHKVTAEGSTMINFNFDGNQDRAFKAALVDMHTAKDIKQMKTFLKSKNFKEIMSSDEDAQLLILKVANSIKRSKGKSLEDADQIEKDAEKLANRAASLGTSMVLGRPSQMILQTLPVLANTLVNSGNLNIRNMFDSSANNFIANSGRGIALRGKEAVSMIESFEKYLDKNPESKAGKAMEQFDNLNNWWLKTFLVNSDTFTANASWLAYYEQSLRKQGVHPGGKIDWDNHEMNEEAADYAQHKIDRQQNISDPDFGGELFTSKTPFVRIASKIIMPFSNFTMNQKSRMYADLKSLRSSDVEERRSARRSLAGLSVETLMYRGLSGLIGYGLWVLANGSASDEEKEKKKKQAINSAMSQMTTDVFSLAPSVNSQTIAAANLAMYYPQYFWNKEEIQLAVDEENKRRAAENKPKMGDAETEEFGRLLMEDKIFKIDEFQKDQGFGVFSIASEKTSELVDMYNKYLTGDFMDENPVTGERTTKYLSEEDRKDVMLPMMLQSLHVLRLLPQEVSQYAGRLNKTVSKNAMSPKQFDKYNKMLETMKLDTKKPYVMDAIKSTAKIENTMLELNYIEENGGLTDKEYAEYKLLKSEYGIKAIGLIPDIKEGRTAKQILGK